MRIMRNPQPIESAPYDGSEIIVASESNMFPNSPMTTLRFPYPIRSRFVNGKWVADFGDRWSEYDPQPTHWDAPDLPPSKGEKP